MKTCQEVRTHPVGIETKGQFALEVHPTEIAFDIASGRALAAVKNHKRFGFNYDPSH